MFDLSDLFCFCRLSFWWVLCECKMSPTKDRETKNNSWRIHVGLNQCFSKRVRHIFIIIDYAQLLPNINLMWCILIKRSPLVICKEKLSERLQNVSPQQLIEVIFCALFQVAQCQSTVRSASAVFSGWSCYASYFCTWYVIRSLPRGERFREREMVTE